jgi:hypothetical protein
VKRNTEAYNAGVDAGRRDANDGSLCHSITPPASCTPDQRYEFTVGYLSGQRAQWNDNQIRALMRAFKPDCAVWTEGVCGDGAVFLRDGVPFSITEVLALLNAAERDR